MLEKLLDWLDRQRISVSEWAAAFAGIIAIRCFLEVFSNPSTTNVIASDAPSTFHYALSYLAIIAGLACIGFRHTGNAPRVWKTLLFGLPIIWLGPYLDLLISGGSKIGYFFHPPFALFVDFFVFLTPWSIVTSGLKIEMIMIISAVGLYVWACRKQIVPALKATFQAYLWLFVIFAIPGLIYLPGHMDSHAHIFDRMPPHVVDYLRQAIATSNIPGNSLHATLQFGTPLRAFEIGFDYLMAQIYYIVLCLFAAWWLCRIYPNKFKAIIKNSRPMRVTFYLVLLTLGMLLANARGFVAAFTWVDVIGTATLMLSWYCAWLYAVHVNDLADASIDAISNTDRPLAARTVSVDEMRVMGYLWLALSLAGAWAVGYYPLFLNIVFTACYYVYSAPPLRLKRVPILSSVLIALAVLATSLAGFFFLSNVKQLDAFPPLLAAGIVMIFTLGVNIRDIKDIEGDKAQGILTLPVLFGRHGTKVVGALFALSFLLAGPVFRLPMLILPSIPVAVAAYVTVIRKPYQEKWAFLLYFGFVAYIIFELTFSPNCHVSSFPFCGGA